jgi:hypothetical protein
VAATGLIAAGIVAIAFLAKTGSESSGTGLGANTWVQIILVALSVVAAIALVVRGAPGPAYGRTVFLLFAAVAVLTAASIAWSVAPDESWVEAARTISYVAAFGTALVFARLLPSQWRVLPTAIALASAALSAWALLVKVLTSNLYDESFGRLLAPFTYWNATGLAAALGVPVMVWLGSRRGRSPVARALAVPGLVLMISVVVLSYSRSAVAASVVGAAVPLAFGRTRLRSVMTLGLGAVGAAIVCGWALHDHNLTADGVPQAARASAGHSFGLVLLVVLIGAGIAGAVVGARVDRARLPEETRRRIGTGLWGVVALIPVLILIALAASSRGFTGLVSHIWGSLTSTTTTVGDTASRLAELSSSRPDYWHEAITVGNHHVLAGAGAGGYAVAHWEYQTPGLATAGHAHGYVFQTYADFGLIGVVISLALLIAWLRSVGVTLERWGRPAGDHSDDQTESGAAAGEPPDNESRRASDREAERDAVWALLGVVAAFAVSSAIDWTWFAPGVALPALVSAGWIAGRGPLSRPVGMVAGPGRSLSMRPGAILAITGVLLLGLAVAWETWQPLRAQNAIDAGLAAQASGDTGAALSNFRTAANAFPVSLTAIQYLGDLYTTLGDHAAARREFVRGTQMQPNNACAWMYLGQFEYLHGDPARGQAALRRAGELNVTTIFTPTTPVCPQST